MKVAEGVTAHTTIGGVATITLEPPATPLGIRIVVEVSAPEPAPPALALAAAMAAEVAVRDLWNTRRTARRSVLPDGWTRRPKMPASDEP